MISPPVSSFARANSTVTGSLRFRCEPAHGPDGGKREEKARDDLVDAKGARRFPQDHGNAAGKDAGKERRALPISPGFSIAVTLTRMCGWPKYPGPRAAKKKDRDYSTHPAYFSAWCVSSKYAKQG